MMKKHVLTEFPNEGIRVTKTANDQFEAFVNFLNLQTGGMLVRFETEVPKETVKEAVDILLTALEDQQTTLYLRHLYK